MWPPMFTVVCRRQEASFCLGSLEYIDTCEHIVVALGGCCCCHGLTEEPGGKSCLH